MLKYIPLKEVKSLNELFHLLVNQEGSSIKVISSSKLSDGASLSTIKIKSKNWVSGLYLNCIIQNPPPFWLRSRKINKDELFNMFIEINILNELDILIHLYNHYNTAYPKTISILDLNKYLIIRNISKVEEDHFKSLNKIIKEFDLKLNIYQYHILKMLFINRDKNFISLIAFVEMLHLLDSLY